MRRVPWLAAGALFVAAVCLVSLSLAPAPARPKPLSLGALVNAPLQELALAVGAAPPPAPLDYSPAKLGARTKTRDCAVDGPYPDRACTPGAVFATTSVDTICVSGYTKTVRSVSTKLKRQVYAQYNLPYPPPSGTYEADHFIPLGLGGNNDIANLFPEAGEPRPGFKEKDIVENYLRQQVCAGDLPLPRAQEAIAEDWLAVYNAIPASEVARLRAQYSSWADKN